MFLKTELNNLVVLQEGCRFKSSSGSYGPNPTVKLGMNIDWKMVGNTEKDARKDALGVCTSAIGHKGVTINEYEKIHFWIYRF